MKTRGGREGGQDMSRNGERVRGWRGEGKGERREGGVWRGKRKGERVEGGWEKRKGERVEGDYCEKK